MKFAHNFFQGGGNHYGLPRLYHRIGRTQEGTALTARGTRRNPASQERRLHEQSHYRGQRLGVLCVQSGRELGLCSLLCASLHLVGTSPKRTPQRLFRTFVPKGVSIETFSAEYILAAADELNGRPRKKLGYRTPEELFDEFLDSVYAAEGCGSIAQDRSQRLPS